MTHDTPAISDALLLAFRRAAEIEYRLIDLERYVSTDRPQRGTPAYWRRWTRATSRLLRLVRVNPALRPHHDPVHEYLLAVHELEDQP